MQNPSKLNPDPIINASVEFRFNATVSNEAVLGVFLVHAGDEYSNFQKLPIADIPAEMRNSDPNLKYAPWFQLVHDDYRLQLGPNVLSISNPIKYKGWNSNFYPFVCKITKLLKKSNLIKEYTRLGLRYVDFFKGDIFEHTTISIKCNDKPLKAKQTSISFTKSYNNVEARVNITNKAMVTIDNKQSMGSVIDTDTYILSTKLLEPDELNKEINSMHDIASDVFFNLLTKDFVNSLNPEY